MRSSSSILVITLLLLSTITRAAISTRPFYAISHMVNTISAVDWAMTQGANAVEMDLNFSLDGKPTFFSHQGIILCDCICAFPVFDSTNVCSVLDNTLKCDSSENAIGMMNHVATKSQIALLVVDSKMGLLDTSTFQTNAGTNVVQLLENELFSQGYGGNVIVSVAKPSDITYLSTVASQASQSQYSARIVISFDGIGDSSQDAACAISTLGTIDTNNIALGTGTSACETGDYTDAITNAAQNRDNGAIGLTYIWTLDKESSMQSYINAGVNGIMSNTPSVLVNLTKQLNITLAVPSDLIPPATSKNVVGCNNNIFAMFI